MTDSIINSGVHDHHTFDSSQFYKNNFRNPNSENIYVFASQTTVPEVHQFTIFWTFTADPLPLHRIWTGGRSLTAEPLLHLGLNAGLQYEKNEDEYNREQIH